MAAIAQLKAMLGLDNKQYKAGVRDSTGATKKFSRELANIGRMMGAAFSVAAIVQATKSVVSFASEIRHTADNLNVTTEGLQALNATALKYGMSMGDMTKALARLRQAQGKAADGDAQYTDAVAALNIELDKFVNANTEEALEMIALGYAKAGGDAAAFAAVTDLLGRAGKNATAFLEELAEKGLKAIKDEAIAAGNAIEDTLITKLELLGTKVEQVQLRAKVGFAQLLGRIGDGASQMGAAIGAAIGEMERRLGDIKADGFMEAVFGGEGLAAKNAEAMSRVLDAMREATILEGKKKPGAGKKPGTRHGAKSIADIDANTNEPGAPAPAPEPISIPAIMAEMKSIGAVAAKLAAGSRAIIEGTRGQANAGGMAQVGIMAGPQREGMLIADRQLKVQVDLRRLNQEMLEELRTLTAEAGGRGE